MGDAFEVDGVVTATFTLDGKVVPITLDLSGLTLHRVPTAKVHQMVWEDAAKARKRMRLGVIKGGRT